jgi:beta-glucosidase
MRRTAFAAAVLAAAAIWASAGSADAATPTYLNPHASVSDRVNDLLDRMTLREEIGQMDQILVNKLRGPDNPADGDCNGGNSDTLQTNCLQRVLADYAVGSILSGGTENPPENTGRGWAELYNDVQRFAIEHSRLHVPILYGVDAVHGFGHPYTATLVPHEIGLGASWDPDLAREAGDAVRQQLMATGTRWNFSPVQDVARDNRWGRYYETWSEDKYLAGMLGAANVSGMQNEQGQKLDVMATVKHFAAYSDAINGHDRVQVEASIRDLQDVFLPSYKAGIDAGAASVMTTDTSINHIPAYVSKFLQTTQLRSRLKFKGVLITDYQNIPQLVSSYHTASNLAEAATQAINAGVDVSMTPFDYKGFTEGVQEAVQRGWISKSRIRQAAARVLTMKFRMGLFENPYVDASKADDVVSGNRSFARRASQESIVLLRNQDDLLPLSTDLAKVVVAGPNADNVSGQLGGWSVSWQGVFGSDQPCCLGPADQIPPSTTVLEGIREAVGPGTNVVSATTHAEAVSQMADADVGVVVVGEKSYAEGLGDRPVPRLDADQQNLVSAMQATGKPVVVVVVAGRPLGLGSAGDANALLMAWQGGTETGGAVADVLFGKVNPSGRLSVTWPSDSGDQWQTGFNPPGPSGAGDRPKFYDQLPGIYYGWGSGYNPQYPIGYGLSYTTFSMSDLSAPATTTAGARVNAKVTVTNTGDRAGTEVVQVYAGLPVTHDIVLAPPRRLIGFARVTLGPGQSQDVNVPLSLAMLKTTPGDIQSFSAPKVVKGTYTLHVGDLNTDMTIR